MDVLLGLGILAVVLGSVHLGTRRRRHLVPDAGHPVLVLVHDGASTDATGISADLEADRAFHCVRFALEGLGLTVLDLRSRAAELGGKGRRATVRFDVARGEGGASTVLIHVDCVGVGVRTVRRAIAGQLRYLGGHPELAEFLLPAAPPALDASPAPLAEAS